MNPPPRRRFRRVLVALGLVILSIPLAFTAFVLLTRPSADMRAAFALQAEWMAIHQSDTVPASEPLAERALQVARDYPDSAGALLALQNAAAKAAKTEPGRKALEQLKQQLATADIESVAKAIEYGIPPWYALEELAPILLKRARDNATHPKAGLLAATVCVMTSSRDAEPPKSAYFHEAADLIAEKFADRALITRFPESLMRSPEPSAAWAFQYEPQLRKILAQNQDRFVRCETQFALAMIVLEQPERSDEARELLTKFCEEFDATTPSQFASIEENCHFLAQTALKELNFRAAGKVAPEMQGTDLDGRPLDLKEYRGKAVLVSFWATWCGPCMRMIPHELELAKQFEGRPFAILGVNGDEDLADANAAVAANQITWQSLHGSSGKPIAIQTQWNVIAWPTFYLIDHHGVIRKRWIDAPPQEELEGATRLLVEAAEAKKALADMEAVVAAFPQRAHVADKNDDSAQLEAAVRGQLMEKTFENSDGSVSKFAVYVPPTYDGLKAVPAIVYLHGSGLRGEDGLSPVKGCLPLLKQIHQRAAQSPMLVIIPQARKNENWTAENSGGRRAMAMLDQCEQSFRIDPKRIILTGLSMGGEGTWSLAAARPEQFAGIVPIAHGGEPAWTKAIANIPCWCFHGDADKMIPVTQSREMIAAINTAGGRARYSELSGAGHEEAAEIAYADPLLLDWMLEQHR